LEEYLNGIQGVRGSSPLSSTIIFKYLRPYQVFPT
jgi:hypothetical protein